MPTYLYYPQGRMLAGVAVEARFEEDDAAMAHAAEVMAAYPDASEVSVWCGERYVGRLPVPAPAAQPKPAATAPVKRAGRIRRGAAKPR